MLDSAHLLLPLFSSLLFVVAAMLARRATILGIRPTTATAWANFVLASCWITCGLITGQWLPQLAWLNAAWIALAFIGGQLSTYLAFRLGDVSLATPVFGVKIIQVAVISAWLAHTSVSLNVWLAAALATAGVAVIHMGGSGEQAAQRQPRRALYAILFAVLAASLLSLFDIGVQLAGKKYGSLPLLATMFSMVGLFSIGLLPISDSLNTLKRLRALGPLSLAACLMAFQAISITFALAQFGDATRVNIIYSLRGLWSVVLAWAISQSVTSGALRYRLTGALLLTIAVVLALVKSGR